MDKIKQGSGIDILFCQPVANEGWWIFSNSLLQLASFIYQQGFDVKLIRSTEWFVAMSNCGIPTIISVLDDVNDKGHRIGSPTPEMVNMRNRVWAWMEVINQTKDVSSY